MRKTFPLAAILCPIAGKIFPTLCLLLISVCTCIGQKRAIYNMFLEEAVPANGTEVVFNAPILRWPYQKGKQIKYEVQLSPNDAFPANNTIIAEGLTGAMFNPHQALAGGNWYWRYRVSGSGWSGVQHFVITANALPMVSPVAQKFLAKIPSSHPRILLNDPLQDVKKMSKSPDASAIIAEAEESLSKKILTEKDERPATRSADEKQDKKLSKDAVIALGNSTHKMVLSLCQAFLLTGNQRYVSKAIDIAMEVAKWDPDGVSGSSDFMDGISMYNMALVFDTFYDKLDPGQKEVLLKAIKLRASRFYKTWVNSIESKVLSGHVWQLLLNEFFKTSIALYNHDKDAAKWLSYAYELFLGRAPILGGLEGGWAEGASYFQMNMETLLEIPETIKSYTGFDFIKAHPWYKNQADWLVYQFPAGSSADGFGDNTEELFEPPVSYAAFATEMAKLIQDPKFSWYVTKVKQYQKIDLSQEPTLRWFRLINAGGYKMPVVNEPLRFPMAQYSKEVGVAALHTDVSNTTKDVMVAIRASPFGAYGHILADQNTFNILFGGKRLFYRTGYKVAMDDPHRIGWSKHTKSMNGVLINGEGEPYSAEAYGYFSRFLQGKELAYIKGNAANAYQSNETKEDYGVTKFNRHIVLLKPGIVVIYDELESREAANWSWLIHSLKNMKLDSIHNTFTASLADARGTGKLWSSQPFTWQLSNKFEIPAVNFRNYPGMRAKKYEDTQWHLKATNKTKNGKLRFLSVIQVGKDGSLQPLKETITDNGVIKMTVGGWQIEANLSYDLSPQLFIHSLSGKTGFTAYGNEIKFHDKIYTGTVAGNSKLAEWVNGKVQFSETGDEPLRPIR